MKKLLYSFVLLVWFLNPNICLALGINALNEDISEKWTYQNDEVSFCAPVFTPQVDNLPILKVKLHQLDEERLRDSYGDTLLQHLNYSGLVDFNFNNRSAITERVGRPYDISVYENIWQDESILETEYAERQESSLRDVVENYKAVFDSLLEDTMITAIPFIAWISTPYLNVKPGTYEYGEPAQFGNLTGVGGYSVRYWPAIRNIPVIMGHDLAYVGPNKTVLQKRLSGSSELSVSFHFSENLWSFGGSLIWKETGVYSEDYELCDFQEVEKTIKKLIEEGKVKDVFSISLGYVIYADPTVEYEKDVEKVNTQEFVAIPTWVIETIYTENPNRDFATLPQSGDPTVYTYSSHIGYKRLNISAQTGKLYDPSDTANDRVYSKDKWQ